MEKKKDIKSNKKNLKKCRSLKFFEAPPTPSRYCDVVRTHTLQSKGRYLGNTAGEMDTWPAQNPLCLKISTTKKHTTTNLKTQTQTRKYFERPLTKETPLQPRKLNNSREFISCVYKNGVWYCRSASNARDKRIPKPEELLQPQ